MSGVAYICLVQSKGGEREWPNGRAEPKGMFDKLAAVTFCCLGVLLLV